MHLQREEAEEKVHSHKKSATPKAVADFWLPLRAFIRNTTGSYKKVWSEYRDSNPRPLGPEPSAIPNFAIPRNADIIMKNIRVVKCQAENINFYETKPVFDR